MVFYMNDLNASKLTFDVYQKRATGSDQVIKTSLSYTFPLLGLFGETGSLLSEVKKKQRDKTAYQGYEKTVLEEIGDTLWYLNAVASRAGIKLSVLANNLNRSVDDWRYLPSSDLKFIDIQTGGTTQQSGPSDRFEKTLLRLAAEVGLLLTDYQAGRLDKNQPTVMGRLLSILRCLQEASEEAGISLAKAAILNLEKSQDRWPDEKRYPNLLDEGFEEHEQLPRQIPLTLIENDDFNGKHVTPLFEGAPLGDKLTDNRMEDDDYRFHDAFHLAFAAKLGWSPNLRRLLKRKRKSDPKIDEVEDGARAVLIEEGVATWVFNRAQRLNLFKGVEALDNQMLKIVREFVEGYEVEKTPLWLWEEAILDGYSVFRQLQKERGGTVIADLEQRTLTFKSLE